MSTRSRRSAYTTTDDENATEEAGPTLRQRSSRRKNSVVPPSPAVPKTPRRGRPPRAGSVDVGTGDEDGQKSGRPVRRSSRLTSPHADLRVPERVMIDSVNLNSPKKSGRPRKSTRTAGPGATATGRGATKRRARGRVIRARRAWVSRASRCSRAGSSQETVRIRTRPMVSATV